MNDAEYHKITDPVREFHSYNLIFLQAHAKLMEVVIYTILNTRVYIKMPSIIQRKFCMSKIIY